MISRDPGWVGTQDGSGLRMGRGLRMSMWPGWLVVGLMVAGGVVMVAGGVVRMVSGVVRLVSGVAQDGLEND